MSASWRRSQGDEAYCRRRRRPRRAPRSARRSTSTSPAASPRRRRSASAASRRRRLPALGASRCLAGRASATAARSISRCSRATSRRTSADATSPSTPSRSRSPAESRSIPSTAAVISTRAAARRLRPGVSRDDPLRLLRAARLEDELELRIDPATEELIRRDAHLVAEPAGERDPRRAPAPVGRRLAPARRARPARGARRVDREARRRASRRASAELRLVAALGDAVFALPLSQRASALRAHSCSRPGRRRTILPARSTASGGRRSRGRSRRWRSWTRARLAPRRRARACGGAGRAALARRRARCGAGPRDRPAAGADSRGTGRRYDQHARGGARARTKGAGMSHEDDDARPLRRDGGVAGLARRGEGGADARAAAPFPCSPWRRADDRRRDGDGDAGLRAGAPRRRGRRHRSRPRDARPRTARVDRIPEHRLPPG